MTNSVTRAVANMERADSTDIDNAEQAALVITFDRIRNDVRDGLTSLLHRLVPLQHAVLDLRGYLDSMTPGTHSYDLDSLERRLFEAAAALRAARVQNHTHRHPEDERGG